MLTAAPSVVFAIARAGNYEADRPSTSSVAPRCGRWGCSGTGPGRGSRRTPFGPGVTCHVCPSRRSTPPARPTRRSAASPVMGFGRCFGPVGTPLSRLVLTSATLPSSDRARVTLTSAIRPNGPVASLTARSAFIRAAIGGGRCAAAANRCIDRRAPTTTRATLG